MFSTGLAIMELIGFIYSFLFQKYLTFSSSAFPSLEQISVALQETLQLNFALDGCKLVYFIHFPEIMDQMTLILIYLTHTLIILTFYPHPEHQCI